MQVAHKNYRQTLTLMNIYLHAYCEHEYKEQIHISILINCKSNDHSTEQKYQNWLVRHPPEILRTED